MNDNYTNHPTIDAFDLSRGTAEDELDLFVAGGSEGSLYTGRLASDFDADAVRAQAIETLLTDEERHILSGEAPDPDERKWDIEARIRLSLSSAKSRLTKENPPQGTRRRHPLRALLPVQPRRPVDLERPTVRIWDTVHRRQPAHPQRSQARRAHRRHRRTRRTVLTGGADGSVRLWDVAAPKQVRLMGSERYSAVNCLALPSAGEEAEQTNFVVGLASGGWQMFDLRSATANVMGGRYRFPPGEAPSASDAWTQTTTAGVTAVDVDGNRVVTGTADGVVVSVWDLRHTSTSSSSTDPPKWAADGVEEDNAEINHLHLTPAQDVLVATHDGLPYRASLCVDAEQGACMGAPPKVTHEYAGWDATKRVGLARTATGASSSLVPRAACGAIDAQPHLIDVHSSWSENAASCARPTLAWIVLVCVRLCGDERLYGCSEAARERGLSGERVYRGDLPG